MSDKPNNIIIEQKRGDALIKQTTVKIQKPAPQPKQQAGES